MKLATFEAGQGLRTGLVLENGDVLDLAEGARLAGRDAAPFASMLALIAGWDDAQHTVAALHADPLAQAVVPAARAKLRAPIPRPTKNVFCVGRNYLDHVAEGDRARGVKTEAPPEHPQFFSKPANTVIGPGDTIPHHAGVTAALDYEVELALVIGKGGADIPAERAFDHIFGYTVLNDVTGRDLQRRHGQWLKGKGLDRCCPIGPWIVTRDELPTPPDLRISLTVNGETRQDSRTSLLIFDIPAIIRILSQGLTLEPGDIIATGTPAGVGYAMQPPRLLKPGDRIAATIEGIGTLENSVVA
jgi:2-keto-4-pentenoate hydratase/2-oxohepta-3-ene-1,7-dioic acid hydratase in catechol pathway